MGMADSRNKNYGKGILNKLKAMERMIRKATEKRVTVVKLRRNKRIGKDDSRVTIKKIMDLAKSTDILESRRAEEEMCFLKDRSLSKATPKLRQEEA